MLALAFAVGLRRALRWRCSMSVWAIRAIACPCETRSPTATSIEARRPAAAETASTTRPPPLIRMPSAEVRVGILPTTLQTIAVASASRMTKPRIQSTGRVMPTRWSSCSGDAARSSATAAEGPLLPALAHGAPGPRKLCAERRQDGHSRARRGPHGLARPTGKPRDTPEILQEADDRVRSVVDSSNWRNRTVLHYNDVSGTPTDLFCMSAKGTERPNRDNSGLRRCAFGCSGRSCPGCSFASSRESCFGGCAR